MLAFGRRLATARHTDLQAIPEELHSKILHELGGGDLLTCQKVCHLWKNIVENTSSLQYKIGLASAGMKDGPPGRSSTRERSALLRKYQETWSSANGVSHRTLSIPPNSRVVEVIGDAFVYVVEEQGYQPVFYLCQLASFFTGVPEKTWKVDVRDHFESHEDIASYAVDVAQDLVVVTMLQENEFPECYLLSLSEGGAPHPLAKRRRLVGNSNLCFPIDSGFQDEIAIVGDLLEWTVFGLDTQMHVFNWKTGM
ncbi:hypothetical protein C8Q80DRAFT_442137 [Daedaleopsis nitida]|nr:hypothetical protein C8Q80DRAFT_442137 [Daedaleopsis nitida]